MLSALWVLVDPTETSAFILWLASVNVLDAIAWVTGIGAGVWAVWKGWPVFKKFVIGLSRLVKVLDALVTLPDDMALVKHELRPNSGKSMKDVVDRTERSVAELNAKVIGVEKQLGEVQGDVVNVDSKVEHVKRQTASLKTSVSRTNKRLDLISTTTPGPEAEPENEIRKAES